MKYDNITKSVFINRPNRFIAEVEVNGHREIVHVKNTGRCKELLIPGSEVWLTASENSARKTRYDLVAVRKNTGVLFNIDSQAPNKVMREWLEKQDFDRIVSEYKYRDHSEVFRNIREVNTTYSTISGIPIIGKSLS